MNNVHDLRPHEPYERQLAVRLRSALTESTPRDLRDAVMEAIAVLTLQSESRGLSIGRIPIGAHLPLTDCCR